MACRGKRVVVSGGSIVNDCPFVTTIHSPEEYVPRLEELLASVGSNSEEIRRDAYRLAYAIFFRWTIAFPLIEMPDPLEGRLAYKSIEDLKYGRQPGLDRIVRILVKGESVTPGPDEYDRTSDAQVEMQYLTASVDRPPRVTVVIPCYNYGQYLEQAVDSILKQTFQDFEILVVNDGSTDNSLEVARSLEAASPTRVRVIDQPNSGQPAYPRNNGIKQARGEYILCLDADDWVEPTMLEKSVAVLDHDPGVSIAYVDLQHFGDSDETWITGEYDFLWLRRTNLMPCATLFRKRVWVDVGGYRTNVKGMEDWDFWIAAGAAGHYGKRVPEILLNYRAKHDGLLNQVRSQFNEKFARIILNNAGVYDPAALFVATNYLKGKASGKLGRIGLDGYKCSVVVRATQDVEAIERTLEALAQNTSEDIYQAVVVADAPSEPVRAFLHGLDGDLALVENDQELGEEASWDQGAAVATGKYLIFLPIGVEAQPGWLEPIIERLDGNPAFAAATTQVVQMKGGDGTARAPLVVRKEVFCSLGGFSALGSSSDPLAELCNRLSAVGCHVDRETESCLLVR